MANVDVCPKGLEAAKMAVLPGRRHIKKDRPSDLPVEKCGHATSRNRQGDAGPNRFHGAGAVADIAHLLIGSTRICEYRIKREGYVLRPCWLLHDRHYLSMWGMRLAG